MPVLGTIIMLTALAIAGVAGYFSIYGLAYIYQGAFLSVVLMGSVLEVGKLVATSYLYRCWTTIGWLLKTYLIIAIFGLMLITSSGIFGYLSSAYQKDTVGVKNVETRIELLDAEYRELTAREAEIDADIGRVGSNYVSARLNLIKQYADEKKMLSDRRVELRQERLALATEQLEIEAHTGPIIYIAKAMGKTIDDAVIWMSLLIIAVFDPLAIALTIAANSVFMRKKQEAATLPIAPIADPIQPREPVPEPEPEPVIEPEPVMVLESEEEPLQLTEQNAQMELDVATLTNELAELKYIHEQQTNQLALLKGERDMLDDHRQELEAQLKQAQVQYQALETEIRSFLNEERGKTSEPMGRLDVYQQNKIKELTAQVVELSEMLETRDQMIEALEQTNVLLEQQVIDMRLELKNKLL